MKLFLAEAETETARMLWAEADRLFSSRLIVPEAWSALARARRAERLSEAARGRTAGSLDTRLAELSIVELTPLVAARAGRIADAFALRGYDAVHLASALSLGSEELVVATWDAELSAASAASGLAVVGATPRA